MIAKHFCVSQLIFVFSTAISLQAIAQVTLPASQLDSTRSVSYERNVTTGLVTAEITDAGSAQHCKRTEYLYDSVGNRTSVTVKNCTTPVAVGTSVFAPRAGTETYSASGENPVGAYPNSLTNAAGHIESRVHNNAFGGVVSLVDSKGLTSSMAYDGFGRKVLSIYPDGNKLSYSYQYCSATGLVSVPTGQTAQASCPASAAMLIVESPLNAANAANGAQKLSYIDAQGRVIKTQTQQFATAGVGGASTYRWSTTLTDYDALGRVSRTSEPHFEGDAPAWTTFTYDALDRVTLQEKSSPFAVGGVARSATAYNGREVTATNPLGATQKRELDEFGRVIRITDTQGNQHAYQFDAWGNLSQTRNALGFVTSMVYDVSGNKAQLVDPDMGSWAYVHDSLGQLRSQTSPRALTTTMGYDTLGRLKTRSEAEMVSTWFYDKNAAGAFCTIAVSGVLPNRSNGELCEATTSTGYRRLNTFDSLGRISQTSTVLASSAPYISKISYDVNGRINQQIWPTGLAANNVYDSLGFLTSMTVAAAGTSTQPIWNRLENNARGQFVKVNYGNGVQTRNTYEAQTGALTASQAGLASNPLDTSIANHSYSYNALGHITRRRDTNHATDESFLYDTLNRLSNQIVTNTASAQIVRNVGYRYNALGNVLVNSEVGNYSYASSKPHAVTSIFGTAGKLTQPQYGYDQHGNIASVSGTTSNGASTVTRTHTWTSFDAPLSLKLSQDAVQTDFLYGPEHQRIRETISRTTAGVTTNKTVHVLHSDNAGALYFEREAKTVGSAAATNENRHYLSAEKGSFLLITTDGAIAANPAATAITALGTTDTKYWHKDHLGSVVASTRQNVFGLITVIERLAYDPFGKRRFTNGTADLSGSLDASSTNRGFTGHEHLDELDLIHMNARVYDPDIGRFLSPDPTIPSITNPQAYNRYSYVYNNPLNATDPDGFEPIPGPQGYADGSRDVPISSNQASTTGGSSLSAGNVQSASVPSAGQQGASQAGITGITNVQQLDSVTVTGVRAITAVANFIDLGYGQKSVESFQRREYGGAAGNALLSMAATGANVLSLGEAAAVVSLGKVVVTGVKSKLAGKATSGITKEVLGRKALGADGAKSAQIIERENGKMISRTHEVTKDGKIIHQHQNHTGKHGGERQFPSEWTGTKNVNAPFENVPPSFPADRVPGGRTF